MKPNIPSEPDNDSPKSLEQQLKGQRRSKKSYSQNKDKKSKYTAMRPKHNDPAWYSVNPELLKDSAQFPYSWPIGTTINFGTTISTNTANIPTKLIQDGAGLNIPGVLNLWLVPSFGKSTAPDSALNLASRQLYTYVRHVNSGSANYDPNDLLMYVASMSSVYAMINFLQRLYGITGLYAQRNRYLPKYLVNAQGVNYESIASNLADFRYRLNLLINKASSFAVPANVTYFKRQAFNFANVYTEGESIKDQMYLQTPARMFKFSLDGDGAGQMDCVVTPMYSHYLQNPTPLATIDDLFNFADSLIEPLLSSEDFGIMNGDILKAYGREGILSLTSVNEEYVVVPKFDLAFLEQIKNATVLSWTARRNVTDGNGNDPYTGYVHQDQTKGYLITNTHFRLPISNSSSLSTFAQCAGIAMYSGSRIITTHAAEPTPEITVENTRLSAVVQNFDWETDSTGSYAEFDLVSGSDFVVFANVVTLENGSLTDTNFHVAIDVSRLSSAAGYEGMMNEIADFSYFEFKPQMFMTYREDNVNIAVYSNWNIDNYTVLHNQDSERLHEMCLMSLLHVNQIAKLN